VSEPTVAVPFEALTSRQAWIATLTGIEHLTKEVEKLANEIGDLRTEVAAENEEDVRTGRQIENLQSTVADLQSKLDQADGLVEAAKNGETDALNQLGEVLSAVREVTEELRADNPTVDNSFPADQPQVDPGDVPYVDPRK
jgi:chromosome segregation ATPase